MILSSLPVSKAVLGLGAAGVVGVTAAGAGIYKLGSHIAEKRNMPKCRIFFARGENSQKRFEETTLEALQEKSYTNKDALIKDVQTACDSTNLTEKPHYRWRVYVKEGTSNNGIYAKDDQKTLGEEHDKSIDIDK